MPIEYDDKEISPPISKKWRIYHYLLEGMSYEQIAKKTNYNYKYISKLAKKYVRDGKLIQVSRYPALFAKKRDFATHIYPVGDFATEPPQTKTALIIPHKIGISFLMYGNPAIPSNRGHKVIKESDHTAIFRRYKAVIWLKNTHGSKVKEILDNARVMAVSLANMYCKKYGIELHFEKVYSGIEWVIPDKERSEMVAKSAGIKEFQRRKVGRAIHKFKDASHDNFEIECAPNEPQEAPTDHAKIHEYLYGGQLGHDLVAIKDTVGVISDSLIQIRQRMEMEK